MDQLVRKPEEVRSLGWLQHCCQAGVVDENDLLRVL